MPYSPIHDKKKSKNYALLIVLLALVAIFFTVGLVKMSARL